MRPEMVLAIKIIILEDSPHFGGRFNFETNRLEKQK